jgi:hypothetical protein
MPAIMAMVWRVVGVVCDPYVRICHGGADEIVVVEIEK